jgi:MFS family permease
LEKERFFAYVCSQSTTDSTSLCPEEKLKLKFVFALAGLISTVMAFPWGYMLDRVGSRCTTITGTAIVGLGMILLAAASTDFDGVTPGLVCIALGGTPLLTATMHITHLFPQSSGVAVCIQCFGFQLSILGFSLHRFFPRVGLNLSFAAIAFILSLLNFITLPSASFPMRISELETFKFQIKDTGSQFYTWRFAGIFIWTSICLLWLHVYLMSEGTRSLAASPETMNSLYNQENLLFTTVGVLIIYPFGYLLDTHGERVSIGVTAFVFTLFATFQLISTLPVQVIFFTYGLLPVMLFATLLKCLTVSFGTRNLGKLVGVVMLFSGFLLFFLQTLQNERLLIQVAQVSTLALSGVTFVAVFPSLPTSQEPKHQLSLTADHNFSSGVFFDK